MVLCGSFTIYREVEVEAGRLGTVRTYLFILVQRRKAGFGFESNTLSYRIKR